MSVIKGTFFSLCESQKSDFYKNERLLFELNYLSKIKKNAKMCKKLLHLYVPFIATKLSVKFNIFIFFNDIILYVIDIKTEKQIIFCQNIPLLP